MKTRETAILFGLAIFFLFTRLYRLETLPMFFDESIFILWSKIIAGSNHQWFIALSGGKNVLLTWLMVIFLKLLPADLYLTAGRLPSVFAGLGSLFGSYFFTRELTGSRRAGLFAALLYIFSPFAALYDRLATYDSLVSAGMIWSAYFAVKTAKSMAVKDAAKWGLVLGIALLSKASSLLFFILTPMVFSFLVPIKSWRSNPVKILSLAAVAVILSQVISNLIIVSRGYRDYLAKSLAYTPENTSLKFTHWQLLARNLPASVDWLIAYITPLILLTAAFGLAVLAIRSWKHAGVLAALTLVPVLGFSFLGSIYFPRYLLFTAPLYFAGAGFGFATLFKTKDRITKTLALALLILAALPAARNTLLVITDPPKAVLPAKDRWQYVSGFPSGYGFETIYSAIDKRLAAGEKITLVVEGSYSHFPYAFKLHYWDKAVPWSGGPDSNPDLSSAPANNNKDITVWERWPMTIDQQITEAAKTSRVYFVVRHDRAGEGSFDILKKFPFEILAEGKKPGGEDSLYLVTLPNL